MTSASRPPGQPLGEPPAQAQDQPRSQLPGQGLGSWPARRARMDPGATALVQGGHRVSYRQLEDRSAALGCALAGAGVGPGDRVAYLGPNDIATFETLFATARLGAIFVPVNTRLAAPEIAFLLRDCAPAALVVAPELAGTFAQAGDCGVPFVLYLDGAGGRDFGQVVAAHEGAAPPPLAAGPDDPALILYTSGTTGRPKGAVLTHGNLTWNTINQLTHFPMSQADVALCAAPLFHVLGLGLGQITLPTLLTGGTVVVLPKFDPGGFLATVAAERATAFPLAPTMMQMLCEHPDWDRTDLSSVRCVPYGGSPVMERVARAWLARGIQVLQGYGMTEAAPGVFMAMRHGSLERPISAGVPHFFTDTALLTADGDIIEGPGQGELLVRGPNVFSHYWNQPAETAEAFVDGWFRSGDIVRVDPDGWAYIVDRVKDIIISGGENIYPAEVEAAICELGEVAAAAVVGVPDVRWGEAGLAFVLPRDGAQVSEADLRGHLDGRLARYKIPREFCFVDFLPRNAAGKLLRRPLREQAQRLVNPSPGEQAP